jgi:serine/threonine protein kinase
MTPLRSSLRLRVCAEDDDFLEFLTALLQLDPARRPTAAEALAHPFLRVA